MTGRPLPDRCWVPALAAALLALAFVGALLVRADGDVSLLVHAAPPWSAEEGARGSLTVQPADDGFDGQFFYRLGVSPWSTAATVEGVTFDLPALRNARWGYGALAFVASGGDPDLVPWALVGLNVAAAAAVGAIGGGLARSSGRHAAWGLLLALWPGFAYSLSLDTSELVASAFLLGALLALRHRRWWPGGLLLAAAVLTRDTTTGVPVAVVAAGAWTWWSARAERTSSRIGATAGLVLGPGPGGAPDRPIAPEAARAGSTGGTDPEGTDPDALGGPDGLLGRDGLALGAAGVLALVAFGGWQLLQRARFDALPLTSSSDNNLSAPFGGLVEQARAMLPPSGGDEAFRLLCMAGLLGLLGAAAWSWRRSAAPLAERLAWLPAVAVVAVLNAYLWSGATAFLRASTEAGLLSTLVLLGSARRRLLAVTAVGLGGFWLLVAASQLAKLG